MAAYYNEIDEAAAYALETLIAENIIAPGVVDRRSIVEVQPSDLVGFTQCHFFAGGGLWSVAARLAGWPDDKPLWTGSCPCQPFSVAGKQGGADDIRHLWPDFFRLISARRPSVVVGEQVAGKAGYGWLDGVRADLAGEDYASRGVDIPALAVDAPHIRQRLYWIAVADAGRQFGRRGPANAQDGVERPDLHGARGATGLADANGRGRSGRQENPQWGSIGGNASQWAADGSAVGHAELARLEGQRWHGDHRWGPEPDRPAAPANGRERSYWADAEWIVCHDGKARRAKPGLRMLVDGMAGRIDLWRIAGNSIVPQLAAEVLKAYLETEGLN